MIYFSIGLPSSLAEWCDATITRLAAEGGHDVAVAQFPGLPSVNGGGVSAPGQAALSLIRSNSTDLMMGVRQPDRSLQTALAETGAPFVLVLNDARAQVASMYSKGQGFQEATRFVANLCPLLMDYAVLPGALILRDHDASSDPLAAMLAIARHFGFSVSDATAQAVLRDISDSGLRSVEAEGSPTLSPSETRILDGAFGAYARFFIDGTLDDISWAPELFLLTSDPQRNPSGPLRLRDTGNGLFLVHGPYMHLPPGTWSVKATIGFSPEAAGQTLTVDAYSGQILAEIKLRPNAGGIFLAEFNFTVDEITAHNIEIRIAVGRDMAPGALTLEQVLLHPISLLDGSASRRGDG